MCPEKLTAFNVASCEISQGGAESESATVCKDAYQRDVDTIDYSIGLCCNKTSLFLTPTIDCSTTW